MKDPLVKWVQLTREYPFLKSSETSRTWTWEDKYVTADFEKLKGPTASLTDRINLLKAFYLSYFGEISTLANLGSLFVQIVASTPYISENNPDDLIKFSTTGNKILSKYVFPPNLEVYNRFLKGGETDESSNFEVEIEDTPRKPAAGGLVDDETVPTVASIEVSRPKPTLKEITRADVIAFKQAVSYGTTAPL